ncbi:MAG: glycine cleavage system protein GcvH [Candidatus Hadarchaeales archaeon]
MSRVETKIPEGLYYTRDHEWAKIEGTMVRVGVTDYAQSKLGDIVYVELPAEGQAVRQLEEKKGRDMEIAVLESIKAVSAVYAPVSGTILEVNRVLKERPELINTDPYNEGWICAISAKNLDVELKNLMNASQYKEYLKTSG